MGKVVAVLHGVGLVQEGVREQAGRLAVNGGLTPTEPTNGGIARGGSAERIREGVTGHLPLEWVAPHEVGARESPFPTDESELKENQKLAEKTRPSFLGRACCPASIRWAA